jgi:Zn ribbon nucleic-acid-binding protein
VVGLIVGPQRVAITCPTCKQEHALKSLRMGEKNHFDCAGCGTRMRVEFKEKQWQVTAHATKDELERARAADRELWAAVRTAGAAVGGSLVVSAVKWIAIGGLIAIGFRMCM